MVKAEWGTDYDWRNDKCYNAPMHIECQAPILYDAENGKYVCIGCGEEAELDDDMKKWLNERCGEKEETGTCMKCGQNTMTIHYFRNHNTTEWQVGHGECTNCGMRFIV